VRSARALSRSGPCGDVRLPGVTSPPTAILTLPMMEVTIRVFRVCSGSAQAIPELTLELPRLGLFADAL